MKKILSVLKNSIKREKNLAINISISFIIKGLSLIISMFSLPLYIRYFKNDEILGIWYTVLSVITWINIFDLGLGNGLRNRLTECIANGDTISAKKYVTSTYILLLIIIIPILVITGCGVKYININYLFGVSSDYISVDAMQNATLILIIGIGVHFVLKIINSIIYALQISSLNNTIALLVSIIPVIFVSVYQGENIEQNMIILSWIHALSINLPLLIVTFIVFFSKKARAFIPNIHFMDVNVARSVLGLGAKFFLAQILFMFLMSTNEILIAYFFSADKVVKYQIYYKIFMVTGSLFMLALTPVWSKVTKDLSEKKYLYVRKLNRVLYTLAMIAIISEFLLLLVLQKVIDFWLKDDAITVDYSEALIFAFFGGMYILNIVLTTVSNGIGELKTQIVFYGIGALIKIPTLILFKKIGLGWTGVILFNSVIILMFCIYQHFWLEKIMNKLINNVT